MSFELPCTCNPNKSYVKMPVSALCYTPTSLATPYTLTSQSLLPQEQAAKLNAFSGKDPAKGVFSIMHSYFETQCKYLLFTKYLTSTNAYCSAEKRAQN